MRMNNAPTLRTARFLGAALAFVLAFAGFCVLGSAYGFLQGAWPFGLVELVWSAIAARRWWKTSPA